MGPFHFGEIGTLPDLKVKDTLGLGLWTLPDRRNGNLSIFGRKLRPLRYSPKLTNVYNQLTGGSRYQVFEINFDLLMVIFVGKRIIFRNSF